MKRFLFSVLLLTTIFALVCSATDTRVLTLGQAGMIVKDDANIYTNFFGLDPNAPDHQVGFPQLITMYRGMVVGEVANQGEYTNNLLFRIGAHYDLGETNGVIGVYVDNRPMPYQAGPSIQPQPESGGVGNRLDVFYGNKFGDMPFGANLMLFHNSKKIEGQGPANLDQSNTALGVNLGVTLMEKLDLGLGIKFATFTNKDSAGQEITKPKSNFGLIVGGRYWWAFNPNVDFVPHLQFVMDGSGYEVPGTSGGEYTDKNISFDVGWGVNVRPVDQVLLLFDLGLRYNKETLKTTPQGGTASEVKNTDMDFPYYKVGLEGHVTHWWDVRLGAIKAWEGYKTDLGSGGGTSSQGTTGTITYLGSGFHFGNLTLDAWIDPDFVLSGPNFVSGRQDDLAMQVSALYTWK
jgi:hypothetical protein